MKFSYNWLQDYISKKLPEPQKLAELLTMQSFQVEEVKKVGNDWILDIDILPNRAHDCLSYMGLGREVSALLGVTPKEVERTPVKGAGKKLLAVRGAKNELCSRYRAVAIEGNLTGSSPVWLVERLAAHGQKSINRIVDFTNHVMLEIGQPLHAFDFDKIRGGRMTIRLAKKGEHLETLDGENRTLDSQTLIIEDGERPIDLAGIKGGANTQTDEGTKRVVLQAAIFNSSYIRSAAQRLGLRTEASERYVHGFDPALADMAIERCVFLLSKMDKTFRVLQDIDERTVPARPRTILLRPAYADKLLGISIPAQKIETILKSLGFGITKKGGNFTVSVPSFRMDVEHEVDLVEEIGRMVGYENIPALPPRAVLMPPTRNDRLAQEKIVKRDLQGFGLSEIYGHSFISDEQKAAWGCGSVVELENPLSSEFRYLRPSILPYMAETLAGNLRFLPAVRLFEMGTVFATQKGGAVKEEQRLAFGFASHAASPALFYALKGAVTSLLQGLGISDIVFDAALVRPEEKKMGEGLHSARRALICVDGKAVGALGELHPRIAHALKLKGYMAVCEVSLEAIFASAEAERVYAPPSLYPAIVRDLAILVPVRTTVESVLEKMETAGGALVRDIDLFDMYEDEELGDGMKSLAFHIIFQSDERTLTSKEVDEIMAKIGYILEGEGWEVRK